MDAPKAEDKQPNGSKVPYGRRVQAPIQSGTAHESSSSLFNVRTKESPLEYNLHKYERFLKPH